MKHSLEYNFAMFASATKQNQWKCSEDVSEMQTRHKSRHAHVVAVGSTKYDSEFQFSDSPLLLQQFCKFDISQNALYFHFFWMSFLRPESIVLLKVQIEKY